MDIDKQIEQRVAKQGERMIEVRIRFWTDGIAEGKGVIAPKQAWSAGVVLMEKNNSHGIRPLSPIPFNSLLELPYSIEKVLLAQGIKFHQSSKMKRYFISDRVKAPKS